MYNGASKPSRLKPISLDISKLNNYNKQKKKSMLMKWIVYIGDSGFVIVYLLLFLLFSLFGGPGCGSVVKH